MLEKTYEYEVGEVLVCRKYLKGKFGKCSVNFEYVVKATKDESIVLKDLHGTHAFELNREVIKNTSSIAIAVHVTPSKVPPSRVKLRSSIGGFSS